jgi:hypothetical protein
MADNIPSLPGGALPPKQSDSKVLPKKETVRITLPPKPSAAPTIKLPTLPPGGPSIAGGGQFAAHAPSAAPATAAPKATAAPASAAAAQRPAQRPVSRPAAVAAPAISGVDKVLAILAAVAGVVAVGSSVYLAYFINYTPK